MQIQKERQTEREGEGAINKRASSITFKGVAIQALDQFGACGVL